MVASTHLPPYCAGLWRSRCSYQSRVMTVGTQREEEVGRETKKPRSEATMLPAQASSGEAEEEEPLEGFVKRVTATFDSSHDYSHACEVRDLSFKIGQAELGVEGWSSASKIVLYAAMLHDVVDHKYVHLTSLTEEGRDKYIRRCFPEDAEAAEMVAAIINNISYSKEVKGLRKDLGERGNALLNIVSDADKITALGEVGIERSLAYAKAFQKGGDDATAVRHVLEHCFEKLLKLRSGFIRTATGKALAEPGHQMIKDWVQKVTATRLNELYP